MPLRTVEPASATDQPAAQPTEPAAVGESSGEVSSEEQPAGPASEQPTTPADGQPPSETAPTSEQPAVPAGEQPAPGAETPPTVEGDQPDTPTEATPGTEASPAAEPGTETPTPPGTETPTPPGTEAQPGANPATLEDRNPVSPPIVNIEVEGNQTVPAQAILEVVSTRIGDPLLEPRLRRDLQAIFDLGYFTDVRFATPTAPGGIRLVFRVLENPVVNGIEFRGNQVVDSAKLAEVIDTKVGEVLNTRTIYSDIQAINTYYNDELGLLRNPTHVTDVAFEDGKVVLTIVDGITVSGVEVTGVTVFPQEQVEALISAKPGELFNRKTLEEDLTKVQQLYEDGEWVLDNVDTKIDPDTGKLTINVLEAVVEELRVVGNSKTRTSVVLKNLRTKPGAVLNRRRFQRDLERLKNLGYFRQVEPEFERGSEKGKVILVLDVEEEKTGLATIGVGYAGGGSSGIRSGITGAVSYSDRNLFGQGKNVSVSWQRGAQISAIALSYFDPAINGNQDSIGVSLFKNEVDGLRQPITVDGGQQFAFYDDNRTGGSFTYGHPLSDDLRVFGTLRHETIEILQDSNSPFTPVGLGTGSLNSVGFSALYDTRDDIFNPHVGTFANGSINKAGFGGDFNFEKYTLEGRYYLPLGENHTIAMRAWGGMVTGDAPITEFFYAGGPDTLRGYQQNQFFGTRFLVANIEYRFPIGNIKFLRGAVFADAGNAWTPGDINEDKIFLDAGLGLRITFPALGLGVIRLDYAFGEDGGRTQIGIGQSF
jgi:outer membrane protein insertion porin family